MKLVGDLVKQISRIGDNFSQANFYIQTQPKEVVSSSTLSVTCYESRSKQALIPCNFKWSKVRNGIETQMPEFKGNVYYCQPSDIGATILVEIQSLDPQYHGTVHAKFGPVHFDVLLRKNVENALTSGHSQFNVDLVRGDLVKECCIQLQQNYITITHLYSKTQYKFNYTLAQPVIESILKDPLKVLINFNEKFYEQVYTFTRQLFGSVYGSQFDSQRKSSTNECKITSRCQSNLDYVSSGSRLSNISPGRNTSKILELKFPHRHTKDTFLIVAKVFNVKKQMKSAVIIQNVQRVQYNQNNFNFMIEIQSLKSDIINLVNQNTTIQQQKSIYFQQCRNLEKEFEEFIITYTKIMEKKHISQEDLNQSYAYLEKKKQEIINRKNGEFLQHKNQIAMYSQQCSREQSIQPINQSMSQHKFRKNKKVGEANCNYVPILSQLDISNVREDDPQTQSLQQKLDNSLLKIEQLKLKVHRYETQHKNHQSFDHSILKSDQCDKNRLNMTAMQISTNAILKQKQKLQLKYKKLLKEHDKLKQIQVQRRGSINDEASIKKQYSSEHKKKQSSLIQEKQQKDYSKLQEILQLQNPESTQKDQHLQSLKTYAKKLLKNNQILKDQNLLLGKKLQAERIEHEHQRQKSNKKITDLSQQVASLMRNQNVLNRSQNLSMQMQSYKQEQTQMLKKQNDILISQNERLTKMCEKLLKKQKSLESISNKS